MKKVLISFYLVACLICTVVAPVSAASEQTLGGSVTVGEVVSITLTDAGVAGINFGSVTPPQTDVNEAAQSEATPAVKVNVEAETNVNVDIGIKGTLSTGSLALSNWKYSQTYAGTKTGLTSGYVAVYTNKAAGSTNNFYHWLDVPALTASGSHTITVSYKAVKNGTSF